MTGHDWLEVARVIITFVCGIIAGCIATSIIKDRTR